MNTQDNTNLAVDYLEVITCTYDELCSIKTPSNGKLYHTSDTNEFYFDWDNKRHKLSVFASDNNIKDAVKKSELDAWLTEHDYVTNLSLVDELVNIIGSPIENIITKQALENYSKNYLLTKEEFGLLDEPLSLIEDIKSLQTSNRSLYAYCDRLANSINEVRSEANKRISSGELDTKLNGYLKTSLAESIYLSKDDANKLYIDEAEFLEKVQNYITRNQLTESLKPYLKKSEVGSIYATKEDVNNKYILKTTANNTFATKNELQNNYVTKESVDEVLDEYLTKNDANEYLKKDVADSSFLKKSDLSIIETKEDINEKLLLFATQSWVDDWYLRKTDFMQSLNDYASLEYVNDKIEKISDDSGVIDERINNVITEINNKLSKFATKEQISLLNDTIGSFAKKTWVDEFYLQKSDIDTKLKKYASLEYVNDRIEKMGDDNGMIDERINGIISEINNKLSKFATKEQVSLLNSDIDSFAKKTWVDEFYLQKSDIDTKLKKYASLEYVNDRIEKIIGQDESIDDKITEINSKLSRFATNEQISSLSSSLGSFAKKPWVDEFYLRKTDLMKSLNDYASLEYVNSNFFVLNENLSTVNDEIEHVVTEIDNKLLRFATKEQINKLNSDIYSTFAKKTWINEFYLKKLEFNEKLEKYATLEYINKELDKFEEKGVADEKVRQLSIEINDKMSKFATRTQVSNIRNKMDNFAQKTWVSDNFVRKGDFIESSGGELINLSESGYATHDYIDEKLKDYATKESLLQKTSNLNNKLYKYATKEQLSSVSSVIPTLAQKTWVSTNFIGNNELLNELKKYTSIVYLSKTLENYMTSDSINELLSQKITEINNKFSKYATNDQLSEIRESLTAFAKKIWVDEFYMKKFKLSDYMKADDIYSIFLEKDVADNIYLTKQDAENIYAKISSIINYTDNDCVTREEASAFAKKVWVDEYYLRKTQFEGIKNAIVLSREFAHESELKQHEGKFIQQGFYYLTAEDTLFCVIDNGQGTGEKIFVNITQLEAGFALYFGGDDVNW